MSIETNIECFKEKLKGSHTQLIAVSKTYPPEVIKEAYDIGIRVFGENKVQEMTAKYEVLPKDIQWHLIGHLQTNKVKFIAPFVHLIHSIDSLKLLKEVNKQGEKNKRIIPCLLQVYIAKEETKFGFTFEEVLEVLDSKEFKALKNISIVGLMGMATFTANKEQIRNEFRELKSFFENLNREINLPNVQLKELSMGMSGDYEIAIEEGSTMIRIGSAIFGKRDYQIN